MTDQKHKKELLPCPFFFDSPLDLRRQRDELREALESLVKAAIPEINEKGAGGDLLARLSDARDVLTKTKESV